MVTLFRSIAVGLVAAVVVLALQPWPHASHARPERTRWSHCAARTPVIVEREHIVERVRTVPPAVSVVDIARGVTPASMLGMLRLGAEEHVVAVDDRPVANDLSAGAALAKLPAVPHDFIDLTVAGPEGMRRVLVLMH